MMATANDPMHTPEVTDAELLERLVAGDQRAFETLMRRHNQRLFRIARAIVKDDADAEDALQEAYLDVYRHAASYRGDAQVSTWLTRVVVNRSLMRMRQHRSHPVLVPFAAAESDRENRHGSRMADPAEPPDGHVLRAEIRHAIERRIDELPPTFRAVFVMRDVEDMTGQEVAEALSLPVATVRTRLFRARALLRAALDRDIDAAAGDVFAFAGAQCDRIVSAVLAAIAADRSAGEPSR